MAKTIPLEKAPKESGMPLEGAIKARRSKRAGWKHSVTLFELSQLLWSAQGKTDEAHRSVPSAGATYPLETFISAKNVEGLAPGIYRYMPEEHALEAVDENDATEKIGIACGKYMFVRDAPLCIIIVAECSRTTVRFGERAMRYIHMEVGSAYQNIALEAVALNLGTVVIGAFDDDAVKKAIGTELEPMCILPIG